MRLVRMAARNSVKFGQIPSDSREVGWGRSVTSDRKVRGSDLGISLDDYTLLLQKTSSPQSSARTVVFTARNYKQYE
jgi:hypothetical protein